MHLEASEFKGRVLSSQTDHPPAARDQIFCSPMPKRSDIDKLFLQAFMTRRVASEGLMVALWTKSRDIVQSE